MLFRSYNQRTSKSLSFLDEAFLFQRFFLIQHPNLSFCFLSFTLFPFSARLFQFSFFTPFCFKRSFSFSSPFSPFPLSYVPSRLPLSFHSPSPPFFRPSFLPYPIFSLFSHLRRFRSHLHCPSLRLAKIPSAFPIPLPKILT